jgi:hypothetical protein
MGYLKGTARQDELASGPFYFFLNIDAIIALHVDIILPLSEQIILRDDVKENEIKEMPPCKAPGSLAH